jgi:hypothetical protein
MKTEQRARLTAAQITATHLFDRPFKGKSRAFHEDYETLRSKMLCHYFVSNVHGRMQSIPQTSSRTLNRYAK